MKIQNKNSGYTILVTLMIIGFLIVVTTGILNLVLRELNDNIGEAKYIQTYAGAEGAMELALLDIKKVGYGVYSEITDSLILESSKEKIKISYDLQSKTNSFSGVLESFEQVVVPLFYMNLVGDEQKVKNIELTYTNLNDVGWNIVSEEGDGIGGNDEINNSTYGEGRDKTGGYISKKINGGGNFLDTYKKNYLIIVNLGNSDLYYNLSSTDGEFTKPKSKIISSAVIGNYKQNLETTLDNTAFLSILKYSIYSSSNP